MTKTTQTISFGLEIKRLNEREFEGYGSTFGGEPDLGGDIIARGAFTETLADHKARGTLPLMFWAHDPAQVPGAWQEMREDDRGLFVKGKFADTQLGNEVRELLNMKAVRGLSIGFRLRERSFNDEGVRVIQSVDLMEVSVVSLAMNPLAQVSRSKSLRLSEYGEYVPTEREFEKTLRDAGLSRTVAKACTRHIFASAGRDVSDLVDNDDQRDVGVEERIKQRLSVLTEASYTQRQEARAVTRYFND